MTVRNLTIDPLTGDLAALINGNLAMVSDNASIVQAVKIRVQAFLGEWFLDDPVNPKIGVPYFQTVLLKGTPPEALRSAFADVVLGVAGVASLQQLDLKFDGPSRLLTVAFRGTGDSGLLFSGQTTVATP